MGHFVFIVLHLVLLLFFIPGLLVTIPAHLIYSAVRTRPRAPADPDAPTPRTHVRCPDCRELVRRDANRCKHCGAALVPQPPPELNWRNDRELQAAVLIAAVLAALFLWMWRR